jgi:hypothetical protein
MANDDLRIPADQFERVIEEMRRFANLIDEQERQLTTLRGITALETRRCFALSSARLQEAGFWFQQALKYAHASVTENEAKTSRSRSQQAE